MKILRKINKISLMIAFLTAVAVSNISKSIPSPADKEGRASYEAWVAWREEKSDSMKKNLLLSLASFVVVYFGICEALTYVKKPDNQ
jgi:hypothetical protein